MFQRTGSEDAAIFAGPTSVGLDTLPDSIRMFIEHQNRIAGRSVGRRGMDDFQSDDHDGSMGEETPEQKRKRKKRYDAWAMMFANTFYIDLYQQVVEHLAVSRTVLAAKREQIDEQIAKIEKIEDTLENAENSEWNARTKEDLRERKHTLKRQRAEIDRHEKEVLEPIEEKLAAEEPPSVEELSKISETVTRSAEIATDPYYPPYYNSAYSAMSIGIENEFMASAAGAAMVRDIAPENPAAEAQAH